MLANTVKHYGHTDGQEVDELVIPIGQPAYASDTKIPRPMVITYRDPVFNINLSKNLIFSETLNFRL